MTTIAATPATSTTTRTTRAAATAAGSTFAFYDLESLSNVFTLCVYVPARAGMTKSWLEVFYLVDDDPGTGDNLADSIDETALLSAIRSGNPGLPARLTIRLMDLRSAGNNLYLAQMMGLSDSPVIGNPRMPDTYGGMFRPVCDTDENYDPARHPFLAGYNSMNYDTTMIALYFMEACLHREENRSAEKFMPVSAAQMRRHNDKLFSEAHINYMPGALGFEDPAGKIRRAMLASGRHLDVARLNELQQRVGLKRLLGMLGHQIKESDKLSHDSVITSHEELYELLAYNVADCLGLSHLFDHPTYSGSFDLKAGLLAQYDDCRFEAGGRIRKDRLTVDASSAKFVGRILSPEGALDDIPTVSFDYPHPQIAAEQGTQPRNVLQMCLEFFETNIAPDPATVDDDAAITPQQRAAHAAFMEVVTYYRSIEGVNFNSSDRYREQHLTEKTVTRTAGNSTFTEKVKGLPDHLEPKVLKDIPKRPNNIPYFLPDASPSSCFATFSTGGIHGAEADVERFEHDRGVYEDELWMLTVAKRFYPDARDLVAVAKDTHNQLRLPDGSFVDKRLVLLGSDPAKVRYRKPKKGDEVQNEQLARAQAQVEDAADLLATQRPADQALDVLVKDSTAPDGVYRIKGSKVLAVTSASKATYREQPSAKKPVLFPGKAGDDKQDASNKLHPRYVRTSAALVVHEDFTSYYPNLLRNMRAFYNPGLGEDRYAKIFFEKEDLGAAMKTPGLSAAERTRLSTLRNGTKLILNSASGAGDAGHDTPIRMNNQIISMRIIGQLFSWMIGQAQTLAGARIISTNTDGLYSVVAPAGTLDEDGNPVFDETWNNKVLAQTSAAIGIDIEPELMFLISKDSNNRLELTAPQEGKDLTSSTVVSASGGTLAAHAGPSPTKALSHPAVIDAALARYLQVVASRGEEALCEPFDHELGSRIITEAIDRTDPVRTLMMFQNVIAASRGSITYPFAVDPADLSAGEQTPSSTDPEIGGTGAQDEQGEPGDPTLALVNPRALQMINRVFVVRKGTPGAVNLYNAGAWKVPAASMARRRDKGLGPVQNNPVAVEILRAHGWVRGWKNVKDGNGLSLIPDDQDVVVRRNNGIDPTWSMQVVNDDLHTLSFARTQEIIDALDLPVYVEMLEHTFTQNWRNVPADER